MFVPRLAAAILVALTLAVTAGSAAHASASAPTSLHGFLLRADEPARTSFPRTPAFAWNPVAGADHYEFQLSTSDTFRDNAVIWSKTDLQSPVAAPPVTLPWITGSPHSLYARVRAYLADGTITPWSDDYGLDITPPPAPSPLPSTPGLLRWTPVPGADGYEVWLIDVGKMEVVFSNVLDEREFYTFHQSPAWVGTVRWRVRALRDDNLGRVNGVPVTQWGPWSSIYTSSNPPLSCPPEADTPFGKATCPIQLVSTVSDVVSDGSATASAHKLMPGFTWIGNQTMTGIPSELFRVYVFTDKQCINRVYTGSVVGSPAYAPRPFGPLQLPTTDVTGARGTYLPDGTEGADLTYDGQPITPTEQTPMATITTTLPLVNTGTPTTGGTGSGSGSDSGSGSGSGAAAQSTPFLDWGDSKFGAPVDLWDTNWPSGGYYWTVVPVAAVSPGALQTTIAAPGGVAGVTTLPVASSAGFAPGDTIKVGNAANQETVAVTSVDATSISLSAPLKLSHAPGEPVVRSGGSLRYVDLELPQDVCAAGRVARFGISSEPSVAAGGDAFASGLSAGGTLTSAGHTTAFYKPPVVAWTPALRAEAYQVQWSKTSYPFVPEADPATGAAGILTGSNAYVLPVAPGTWYYRVRGYDYSLPSGAQQMGWSDIAKVKVAAPTFQVVGGGTGAASTTHKTTKPGTSSSSSGTQRYSRGHVSVALPKTWIVAGKPPSGDILYAYRTAAAGEAYSFTTGTSVELEVSTAEGRGHKSWSDWAKEQVAAAKPYSTPGTVHARVVTEPGGKALLVTSRTQNVKNGRLLSSATYLFDAGSKSYFLDFTSNTANFPRYSAAISRAAASFRFH